MRFCTDAIVCQITKSNGGRITAGLPIALKKRQYCFTQIQRPKLAMTHEYSDLITLFNDTFYSSFNTKLELGGDEPIYLPADDSNSHHRIIFARGFYASALHEIAHWCVAGPERRLMEDFGYWYEPDGRDANTQAKFEKVEIRPQAYEWILSQSAGFRFQVSCDNLHGEFEPDRFGFMQKVHAEVIDILEKGLPTRVEMLSNALREHYSVPSLTQEDFKVL
ncbi:elongation factor P hydroxylase [Vibrio breoganii]|nr:elongation factor P hydroxylase [Vibrio breoganii]PMO76764.1 elongation factor P hydroxylase [Vibrio breoganii]PMO89781.1 elongation factor P hydroxylase [Vibrio breoganii]